jgi:L-methionine (R)-S-oxide reductase
MSKHDDALQQVEALAAVALDAKTLMQNIADHLHSVMARYNSVSFRLIDESSPRMLILGPYTGSFTPQLRIAFGQGLCGTAAATEKAVVVDNVAEHSQYLRASAMVKSEIVVPIFVRGKLMAEIDIQSYFAETFKDPNDRSLVESCAGVMAQFMETHTQKV